MPIYPSIKGGGVSQKNVKWKGFKMFSAVSKKKEKTLESKKSRCFKCWYHTTIKTISSP
jgi:hypothetical protein